MADSHALNPVNIKFKVEKIHHYPFHVDSDLRLIYAMKGQIEIVNVSGNILLKEGDLEFISINEPSELIAQTEDNMVVIMSISKKYLLQYDPDIDKFTFNVNAVQFFPSLKRNLETVSLENAKKLKLMFLNLFKEYRSKPFYTVHSDNLELFCHLIIDSFNDMKKHLSCLPHVDEHLIQRFLRIESYILNNLGERITLNDLATTEFLCPQYISAEFKNKYDRTFGSIVEYYRIRMAVRLMLESDMKIAQIVHQCGFSDSKYFYRAFKKHMGCTPAQFKNKLLNSGNMVTNYFDIMSEEVDLALKAKEELGIDLSSLISDLQLNEIHSGYYLSNVSAAYQSHQYCLVTASVLTGISVNHNEIWFYHDGSPLSITPLLSEELKPHHSFMLSPKAPMVCLEKGSRFSLSIDSGDSGKGFTLISIVSV